MKLRMIPKLLLGALGAVTMFGADQVRAQYPEKPITLILPLGAGGSHDRNARVFTSTIPQYLGNAMIVKLMPGASGQVGTAAAAKAKMRLLQAAFSTRKLPIAQKKGLVVLIGNTHTQVDVDTIRS